jgi:hypothetical protein
MAQTGIDVGESRLSWERPMQAEAKVYLMASCSHQLSKRLGPPVRRNRTQPQGPGHIVVALLGVGLVVGTTLRQIPRGDMT